MANKVVNSQGQVTQLTGAGIYAQDYGYDSNTGQLTSLTTYTNIRIDPNPGGIYEVTYTPVGSQYAEPATVTRMAEDGGSSLWISVDPLPALDNLTMQNAYSIPYNSTVTMWRSLGSTTGAWDSEGPTQSLELDLPAAKSIDEVKITPEAEFDYVQYFDGHDWQNVAWRKA